MKNWWKKWYGAPFALLMVIGGFCIHPIECIGQFIQYYRMDKGFEHPMGLWTTIVRACTDINMC